VGEVLEDPFRGINLAGQLNESVVPESEAPPHPLLPNNAVKGIMWGHVFLLRFVDIPCLSFCDCLLRT
jgi:hypothetical protein